MKQVEGWKNTKALLYVGSPQVPITSLKPRTLDLGTGGKWPATRRWNPMLNNKEDGELDEVL